MTAWKSDPRYNTFQSKRVEQEERVSPRVQGTHEPAVSPKSSKGKLTLALIVLIISGIVAIAMLLKRDSIVDL